ncbi:hypothetical protein MCERH10_01292 [Caulobacteraceae bacterium]
MLVGMMTALSLMAANPSPGVGLNVPELCQFVAENLSESDTSRHTRFRYQRRLFQAAGVDPSIDDAATKQTKMQTWWNLYQDQLICNVPHSIVRNGNILKLAVDRSSSEFINDAVRRWKVDLNLIDADGTTVLDFIDQERLKAQGTPRFATLNSYYNIFAGGGAKHRRDLQ